MLKFDWNILWTLINLLFFFVLIRLTLFKPIKKVLDKRQELIDNQFEDAQNAQNEAQSLKAEYQSELDNVQNEKTQIIVDARADAKVEYGKIVERANADAEKIKADARKSARLETEKARLAVKEEIAELAMDTAQKIVEESSSKEIDRDIYNKFLNESSDE